MSRRRKIIIGLVVLAAAAGIFLFWQSRAPAYGCVTAEEKRVVQGDSLTGVLADGSEINILENYYACHDVQRGDIVVYNYPGAPDPLVKIAEAVPGDSFSLVPNASSTWTIYVNGSPLVSPRGGDYTVYAAEYPRFHLYEHDYGKSLPPNVYMILGTDPRDSYDSRVFGLVGRSDIIGKAEILRNGK